jgi:hypothetical protein
LSESQRLRRHLLIITPTIGLSVTKAEIAVEWLPLGGVASALRYWMMSAVGP